MDRDVHGSVCQSTRLAKRRVPTPSQPDSASIFAPGVRGGELLGAWLVAAMVSAVSVGVAAAHGALGAARNDDWAYSKITFHLAHTGSFVLDRWTQTMLFGQSLLSVPVVAGFGDDLAVLQVMVAVIGLVGLVTMYAVARRFLPTNLAVPAVLSVAIGPIYGSIAVSYMTDVPALTAQMLALYAALRAFELPRLQFGWVVASMAAGVVAFSIREYSAATVVAVGVVLLLRSGSSREARRACLALAAALACMAALLLWRRELPGNLPTHVGLTFVHLRDVPRTFATLSVLMAPTVLVISPRKLIARLTARGRMALGAGALVLALLERTQLSTLVQNYVTPTAAAGLLGERGWKLVLMAGLVIEIVVLAVALVGPLGLGVDSRSERSEAATGSVLSRAWTTIERSPSTAMLFCFVVVNLAFLFGMSFLTASKVWDRYLVPVAPMIAVLALASASRSAVLVDRRRPLVTSLGLVAFGVFGFSIVENAAIVDGQQWRLGEQVVAAGHDPSTIDTGYAWFGYHQTTPMDYGETLPRHYTGLFPERVVCVTATNDVASVRPESVVGSVVEEPWIGSPIVLVAVERPCGD